jgi:N-acetylneuraminate synthase
VKAVYDPSIGEVGEGWNRSPGQGGRCFVIAEAGVNHNGSLTQALRLVDAAAESGADAVKFQTFRAASLASASAPKADYQRGRTGKGGQREMLRALELSRKDHEILFRRCQGRGIQFLSTPFDEKSAKMLVRLGVEKIKVPSGELTNRFFLEFLSGLDLPLIVSTGMATLVEVNEALQWIRASAKGKKTGKTPSVTLLHCTSSYPTALVDVNLRAMVTLREAFHLPVGYSDHTKGTLVAGAAVILGAEIIEKHLTLDRRLPGPDHAVSLEPREFKRLVRNIRDLTLALGDGIKSPRASELNVRDVARRSLVAVRNLPVGHRLAPEDVEARRPGTGIPPKFLGRMLSRVLVHPVRSGEVLTWKNFGA